MFDNYYDLTSGIGGFAYAACMAGLRFKRHFFSEINEYCIRLYRVRFPGAEWLGDLHDYERWEIAAGSSLCTAGFPCQPFSNIGGKQGRDDNRYLWPVLRGFVRRVRPDITLFENVPPIDTGDPVSVLEEIYDNLEDDGYTTLPPIEIPAASYGAPHLRNRVWILAHSDGFRWERGGGIEEKEKGAPEPAGLDEDRFRDRLSAGQYGRGDYGFSAWMDRLKGLGNAIFPVIAERIFRVIKAVIEEQEG